MSTDLLDRINAAGLPIQHVAQIIGVHRVTLHSALHGKSYSPEVRKRALIYVEHIEQAQREALRVLAERGVA